jgi:hypothetical protein
MGLFGPLRVVIGVVVMCLLLLLSKTKIVVFELQKIQAEKRTGSIITMVCLHVDASLSSLHLSDPTAVAFNDPTKASHQPIAIERRSLFRPAWA